MGFYFLLTCQKKTLLPTGFFIGIFWFYWISFSFRYYDLSYLIPLVILGVGIIYGLIFWFIGFLGRTIEIRAILLLLLSFFSPFGFNWFKPELIFINSYFSTNLYLYGLFLLSLILLIRLKKQWKILGLTLLIALCFINTKNTFIKPSLHVAIPIMNLSQDKKWEKRYKNEITKNNFAFINKAINDKQDLIILPESAFPTYLNLDAKTLEKLKLLSYKITILTGALSVKNNKVFNSSYLLKNGEFEVANKVVLVPFGEKIPFPKFAVDFINKTFFDGADDYESATKVHNFTIDNYTFRNAICFEATVDKLYENSPKYMIAISNNAWFTPSIEPTLQNLLLKYYARKYNTIIYHSANSGISTIIYP